MIKGGQIVHVGNAVTLIDRLQTAGPGNVNIRRETIYELGNYLSVGQISDLPDLSFSMESFDVSCEIEAFLLRQPVDSAEFDLSKSKIVNIKSAFKPGQNATAPYDTAGSAAIPALRVEQVQYRFGVGNQNARQTVTLKGDSLYYNPGSCYIQEAAGTNTAGQSIVLTNPAYAIVEGGVERRTLAVTAGDNRLNYGLDYTETVGSPTLGAASVTVVILAKVPTTDVIAVTYASSVVEVFPQSVHALVSGVSDTLDTSISIGASTFDVVGSATFAAGNFVIIGTGAGAEVVTVASQASKTVTLVGVTTKAHSAAAAVAMYVPTVKPAAIRGRDIDIYIGPGHVPGTSAAAARGTKRPGVQSVDVDFRVTLQQDEELGNYHYTDIDFDVPSVSGNLTVRPRTVAALQALVNDLGGNSDTLKSVGVSDAPLLDVQIDLKNPLDGRVLKTLHIPDARFTVPGYSGRVQQTMDLQSPFQSDQGILKIYPGAKV